MRFKMLPGLLVLICASVILAESKVPAEVKAERDIRYVPDGDAPQSLDLYLPEKESDKPLPVVVYIHGGGWHAGSKAGCWSLPLVKEGYAAASVEYRFSDKAKFPAQIQDCQAAIRWLRANSKKYHLDPDHIGVMGDSAGGHLSALLGTSGGKKIFPAIGGNEDQSDRVQAVCDFYGPTDFTKVMAQAEADEKNVKSVIKFNMPSDPYSSLIGVKLGEDETKGEAVSPIHYVSKDNPPFLIFHGTKDALVPLAQSEELVELLKKAGVPVHLQVFEGAGHGGPVFLQPPSRAMIKNFFDKNLKGIDVKVEWLPEEK